MFLRLRSVTCVYVYLLMDVSKVKFIALVDFVFIKSFH